MIMHKEMIINKYSKNLAKLFLVDSIFGYCLVCNERIISIARGKFFSLLIRNILKEMINDIM